jgi:hypothetical protein
MNFSEFARLYAAPIAIGTMVLWGVRFLVVATPVGKVVFPKPSAASGGGLVRTGHVAWLVTAFVLAIALAIGQYRASENTLTDALVQPLLILMIPAAYAMGWSAAKGARSTGVKAAVLIVVATIVSSIVIFMASSR